MKRAYYYFLFRIFRFYKDKYKENDQEALFGVVCVSTVCIFSNLLTIYCFFLSPFFDIIPMFSNKYWVIAAMIMVGICNYLLFIKNRNFLEYEFTKDRKGSVKIFTYYVISLALFIVIANINREKIFAERKAKFSTEQPEKQNSLESKLRDWWNNKDK